MQQISKMPDLLCEGLMDELVQQQGGTTKRCVLDLFAGGESWMKAVEGRGFTCIPVDIRAGLRTIDQDKA